MADVTSLNEEDWGPWQDQVPPIGSIFILRTSKEDSEPTVASGVARYKLVGLNGTEMLMDHWSKRHETWNSDHSWDIMGASFRVLKAGHVAASSNGCHCRKCGNHFPFAEANQPDGTLICWNCRNYPHYKGRL